ncbi:MULTISPECIES: hypothetical protein [Bacillaceae]|uniref:Ribbon-helix-helix protein CopG domain-containing protein n=1 Tax=Evansella alkalicola TaxID=745819 RepID=A0ABS6JWV7_9BACI|nr:MULTISPECIES: hypothetical protein [Bacillaceae]MBU9722159.1 hypothetical protein [Bacillus alkalicola]
MKITKEQLQSKKPTIKRGMQWFTKTSAEKAYDGKIKLRVTEFEYNAIVNTCRELRFGGYKPFCRQAIERFEKVTELTQPHTTEEPQDWLTFTFDKEVKEPLIKEAKKAGLSLEEFVRALVWTRVKQVSKHDEEQKKKQEEQRRKQSLCQVHFNLSLTAEMVERYETKYGRAESKADIENKIKELILKELA